jgi:hypothetical protein
VPTKGRSNFPENYKAFDVSENFCRKRMPKDFANCKPATFVALQVASFCGESASLIMPQMPVLGWKSQMKVLRHDAS